MYNGERKTFLGFSENMEAFLCYLLGWVTGIMFLLLEKKSRFVKFHALQSVLTFLPLFVLGYILGVIPIIGTLLVYMLNTLTFLLWIILMYKAYKHEWYKLPVVGELAKQQTE